MPHANYLLIANNYSVGMSNCEKCLNQNTGLCFSFILFKMTTPKKSNVTRYGVYWRQKCDIWKPLTMSQMTFSMDCSNLVIFLPGPSFYIIGTKDNKKSRTFFHWCNPCLKYPVYICMYTRLLFTICIRISVFYALPYAWEMRQAVCSCVYT